LVVVVLGVIEGTQVAYKRVIVITIASDDRVQMCFFGGGLPPSTPAVRVGAAGARH